VDICRKSAIYYSANNQMKIDKGETMGYENVYLKMVGKSDIKCLIMEIEKESRIYPEKQRNIKEIISDIDLIFTVMEGLRIQKIPGHVFFNILYSCRFTPDDISYYKSADEVKSYIANRLIEYKEDGGDFDYGVSDHDSESGESIGAATKTIYDIIYNPSQANVKK